MTLRSSRRKARAGRCSSAQAVIPSIELIEVLEDRRLLSASVVGNVLTITGTEGPDRIYVKACMNVGGRKIDVTRFKVVINAKGGDDKVWFAPGLRPIYTVIRGGAGNDRIQGSASADKIFGESGNDVITDQRSGPRVVKTNVFYGGGGNDKITGQCDPNKFFGDCGDDTLIGGNKDDTMSGGGGNDLVNGGTGNDKLQGGQYENPLIGDDGGPDTVIGGGGNDAALSGVGDLLSGVETVVYTNQIPSPGTVPGAWYDQEVV